MAIHACLPGLGCWHHGLEHTGSVEHLWIYQTGPKEVLFFPSDVSVQIFVIKVNASNVANADV